MCRKGKCWNLSGFCKRRVGSSQMHGLRRDKGRDFRDLRGRQSQLNRGDQRGDFGRVVLGQYFRHQGLRMCRFLLQDQSFLFLSSSLAEPTTLPVIIPSFLFFFKNQPTTPLHSSIVSFLYLHFCQKTAKVKTCEARWCRNLVDQQLSVFLHFLVANPFIFKLHTNSRKEIVVSVRTLKRF